MKKVRKICFNLPCTFSIHHSYKLREAIIRAEEQCTGSRAEWKVSSNGKIEYNIVYSDFWFKDPPSIPIEILNNAINLANGKTIKKTNTIVFIKRYFTYLIDVDPQLGNVIILLDEEKTHRSICWIVDSNGLIKIDNKNTDFYNTKKNNSCKVCSKLYSVPASVYKAALTLVKPVTAPSKSKNRKTCKT